MRGQVALVTGGQSGIGRAVAIALAKEGADVAISYADSHDDAQATVATAEQCGRRCVAMAGDLAEEDVSRGAVAQTINQLGRLDVLVNNAAEQHEQQEPAAVSAEQLHRTFAANVYSMFYCVNAALLQMKRGARIINTTAVAAYSGHPYLIDYAASKGAAIRSLPQKTPTMKLCDRMHGRAVCRFLPSARESRLHRRCSLTRASCKLRTTHSGLQIACGTRWLSKYGDAVKKRVTITLLQLCLL